MAPRREPAAGRYCDLRGRVLAQCLTVTGRQTGERPMVRSEGGACPRATYAAQVLRAMPRYVAQSEAVHQSDGKSAGCCSVVTAHQRTGSVQRQSCRSLRGHSVKGCGLRDCQPRFCTVPAVRLVRLLLPCSAEGTIGTNVNRMASSDADLQVTSDSGERLRVLLQRAQLAPEQLARHLNRMSQQMGRKGRVDQKTPYKWLKGAIPRDPWPALAAAVLSQRLRTEIQPRDIGWPTNGPGLIFVSASSGLEVPWNGTGAISAAYEVSETNVMDRRVFLQLAGSALTQPAFDWLLARPANDVHGLVGRRVVDSHVDSIETIASQLRHMDDQFGGGAVLDLVKSQIRFVLDLLREHRYTSSVGMRLHGAAAELLRLAGWVNFDAGQHPEAQRFWVAALHAAHSAGDRSLGANVLGFMSCQAKDLGLNSEAVRLADAARQGYPGASPLVSAILNLRSAQAYARANDTAECQAAIDVAYEVFRGRRPDDVDPAWAYWLDESQVNEQAGYCYMQLGRLAESGGRERREKLWQSAQNHLSTALRLQAEPFGREGTLRQALLARVYAYQAEPERACEIATKAVDTLADDVDSARVVGHIRQVQDALASYRKMPVVREFNARVEHVFGPAI